MSINDDVKKKTNNVFKMVVKIYTDEGRIVKFELRFRDKAE